MNVFKNFIRVAMFFAVILTVACTKDDMGTDLFSDDITASVNELVASGTGAGGPGGDSTKPGGHRHWKGGHGEHPGRSKGDSIGLSGLPQAAQAYLLANTDTSKLKRIAKITLADGTFRYVARLITGKHFHFDAAGAVVTTPMDNHVFTEILFTDLPAAAQTYILANTTLVNVSMVIKITKPDGTVVYGVRLADNKHYAFDAAGALLVGKGHKKRH